MPAIRNVSLRSPQKKSFIKKINESKNKEIIHRAIDVLNERKQRLEEKKKMLISEISEKKKKSDVMSMIEHSLFEKNPILSIFDPREGSVVFPPPGTGERFDAKILDSSSDLISSDYEDLGSIDEILKSDKIWRRAGTTKDNMPIWENQISGRLLVSDDNPNEKEKIHSQLSPLRTSPRRS